MVMPLHLTKPLISALKNGLVDKTSPKPQELMTGNLQKTSKSGELKRKRLKKLKKLQSHK